MSHAASSPPPRPILRWAGSKRRQLHLLRRCVPRAFGTYFEPFVGSASLYLAIGPCNAVLSDLNNELIEAYRAVRRDPGQVGQLARSIPSTSDHYYRVRGTSESDPIAAAARFIYLNRYCFNGIYRTDRRGAFNVPYGSRTGSMPEMSDFRAFARAIRKAKLLACDFADSLAAASGGDFAYLDPPYLTTRRSSYGEYGYGTYRDSEIDRLIDCLCDLDRREVKVLLSYRTEERLIAKLKTWSITTFDVYRNVAAHGKQRLRTTEILASNYVDLQQAITRSV